MAGNKATRPRPYPGSWNNPGNIVYSKKVTHPGQNGSVRSKVSGNTFLTFDTPQNGLNAMGSTVGQIIREKIPQRFASGELPDSRFNIENFVKVYAPKKDNNDTDEYIRFVSGKMGVGAKDDLDPADGTRMAKFLETLVRRDSGHEHADWFTPEEYSWAAGKVAPATRQAARGGEARAASRGSEKPRESTAPTDDQIGEALEFLEMFRENEKPENEFEANAIEKLYNLVTATYEKTVENRSIRSAEEQPAEEQPAEEQPVADDRGGEAKNVDEKALLRTHDSKAQPRTK